MRDSSTGFSTNKKWLVFFGLWLLFLSGAFTRFVGSPGILQSVRLRSLLVSKRGQLKLIQDDLKRLQIEKNLLETNRFAQEREIRKVLGYASNDEIIFDFTPSGQY